MKIAKRLTYGFGFLIGALVVLAIFHVFSIRLVQSFNEDLSQISFRAGIASLRLMRARDRIEERAVKAFADGGRANLTGLRTNMDEFEASLQEIQSIGGLEKEQGEIARLSRFWREFSQDLQIQQQQLAPEALANFPAILTEHLERLDTQIYTVYELILQAIRSEIDQSAISARRAALIASFGAASIVVLGVAATPLVIRSIWVPLSALAAGTRAMADGRSFYRLDTSRDDELAQIAKDFNTLIDKMRSYTPRDDARQNQ